MFMSRGKVQQALRHDYQRFHNFILLENFFFHIMATPPLVVWLSSVGRPPLLDDCRGLGDRGRCLRSWAAKMVPRSNPWSLQDLPCHRGLVKFSLSVETVCRAMTGRSTPQTLVLRCGQVSCRCTLEGFRLRAVIVWPICPLPRQGVLTLFSKTNAQNLQFNCFVLWVFFLLCNLCFFLYFLRDFGYLFFWVQVCPRNSFRFPRMMNIIKYAVDAVSEWGYFLWTAGDGKRNTNSANLPTPLYAIVFVCHSVCHSACMPLCLCVRTGAKQCHFRAGVGGLSPQEWRDTPWLHGEIYFYHRILEATGSERCTANAETGFVPYVMKDGITIIQKEPWAFGFANLSRVILYVANSWKDPQTECKWKRK